MEPTIILLCAASLLLLFFVSGKKAFRSLLALAVTFFILVSFIIPPIVKGHNPVWVVLLAALPIVILIVYLTEGVNRLSHISIFTILLNFILTSLIIYFSVRLAGLVGLVSEDAGYLGATGLNLQKLLVAGIMLGTLGVLTEMVVTQVATVMEFIDADPAAEAKIIYRRAYGVGIAHLGSIINTLFLVYAGVSFPLVILYASGGSLSSALNYEPLAGEIIRTLTGTLGLIIAMPTSTALAAWWLKKPRR